MSDTQMILAERSRARDRHSWSHRDWEAS